MARVLKSAEIIIIVLLAVEIRKQNLQKYPTQKCTNCCYANNKHKTHINTNHTASGYKNCDLIKLGETF